MTKDVPSSTPQSAMIHSSVCLHAEMLHDDGVWRLVERALGAMEESGWRATFLVYPLRGQAAGRDARSRVRQIAALGHEVGQHTHFYSGREVERTRKRTDLSDRNVRDCLLRDYEWLRECGVEPKGFCAGNFMTTETVFESLAELGFLYDCSARLPWQRRNYELPHTFLEGAQVRRFGGAPLVMLPNTEFLTLAQALSPSRRRRTAALAGGGARYELINNHDYDLPLRGVWLGLQWRLRRGPRSVETRRLAEMCLEGGDDGRH